MIILSGMPRFIWRKTRPAMKKCKYLLGPLAFKMMGVLVAAIILFGCAKTEVIRGGITPSNLTNGAYKGSYSKGPNKAVVMVTIENGRIKDILLKKHRAWKGKKAGPIVIQRIIENQSTRVDAVSGATNSSIVIMNAVQKAIEKAYAGH
jgi:uncharacterized protein with FMN-binding domain